MSTSTATIAHTSPPATKSWLKRRLRSIVNWSDSVDYCLYRPAGRYGTKWDKSAENITGVLRIEVLKGRGLPRSDITNTYKQYAVVRIGEKADYSSIVANSNGEPVFRMKSYFKATHNAHNQEPQQSYSTEFFTNTLVEISIYNYNEVRDVMVGRVVFPVKELRDVRMYHGWVCLDDSNDNPAGFIYVSCTFHREMDSGYDSLLAETMAPLSEDGEQYKRQQDWLRLDVAGQEDTSDGQGSPYTSPLAATPAQTQTNNRLASNTPSNQHQTIDMQGTSNNNESSSSGTGRINNPGTQDGSARQRLGGQQMQH